MRKASVKNICLLLIISLNWRGLATAGETRAYFLDTETSSGNIFTAATLDFHLDGHGSDFTPEVTPSDPSAIRDIDVISDGSLSFGYQITIKNVSGDLCGHLTLKAELDGAEEYSGPISEDQTLLSAPLPVVDPSGQDDWTFTATLNSSDSGLQGKTCDFDFDFDGEQIGSSGFSDQETISNTVTVGTWEPDTWTQTSQSDFEKGVLSGVDTTTSHGDVMLTGAYSPDGNTVGLWHLNEGSGSTADDETTNNNDGTVSGAVWVSGKYDDALEFDGGGNVDIPDSSSLKPASVTLEAWVRKSGSPGAYRYIAAKYYASGYASYGLYTSSTGGLSFYIGHTGGFVRSSDVGTGIWDGNWHHIAGTYDGSYVRLYVDNVEVGLGVATSVDIVYNANNFYIGSYGNGYYFDGVIDEVRVSNIARTSFPVSYFGSGTLESQSFDSGQTSKWHTLGWDETLPSGDTDITLEGATSGDGSTWSAWQLSSSTSPIDLSSLPETRYIKWKAALATSDTGQTPVLHDVQVEYYPGAAAEHIVLNEFLPNPEGGGEWVEIYNKEGGPAVDLGGWYVEDEDGNTQTIAEANTDTDSTVIGTCGSGGEWLVVYLGEEMLDDDGDTVYLYDTFGDLIDSYSYEGNVPVDKSYARIPDGTGDWVDPIPTPGGPNKLESVEEAPPEMAGEEVDVGEEPPEADLPEADSGLEADDGGEVSEDGGSPEEGEDGGGVVEEEDVEDEEAVGGSLEPAEEPPEADEDVVDEEDPESPADGPVPDPEETPPAEEPEPEPEVEEPDVVDPPDPPLADEEDGGEVVADGGSDE